MAKSSVYLSVKYWTWDRHLDKWRKRKANKSIRHNVKNELKIQKDLTN